MACADNRFKSYYGEIPQIALAQVPADRRVISVLPQQSFVGDYIEVVTELTDLVATDHADSTDVTNPPSSPSEYDTGRNNG